jgi:hypothetical protein
MDLNYRVTSELLDWIELLASEDIRGQDAESARLRKLIQPLHGALEERAGCAAFRGLAFLNRRKERE